MGIALATIVQLRLLLPGPLTEFSTADNPVAKSNSIWTRFLTFTYLPVINFKLLLYPSTLSFDWGMDAIPRLTSIFDARNVISLVFYASLTKTVFVNVNILKTRFLPVIIVQRRVARTKKKQQSSSIVVTSEFAGSNSSSSSGNSSSSSIGSTKDINSNGIGAIFLLSDQQCVCTVCKQGQSLRHSSSCRAINNNNVPSPSTQCGCPPFRHSSPSPSQTTTSTTKSSMSAKAHGRSIGIEATRRHFSSAVINDSSTPPTAAAILLSIALLALPFLPAANLFFYVGFVVAERILYLPSVGYCLLVGLGVGKLMDPQSGPLRSQRKRYAMLFCVGVMLVACSVKTVNRNLDWRDEESLYRSAISVNPPKGECALLFFANKSSSYRYSGLEEVFE